MIKISKKMKTLKEEFGNKYCICIKNYMLTLKAFLSKAITTEIKSSNDMER